MPCEECQKLGIPDSLCSEGKGHPLDFVEGEVIYRRHNQPGDYAEINALSSSEIGNKIFKLKDDSYNRSSLSTIEQVLLNPDPSIDRDTDKYINWGIISLKVADVNSISEEVDFPNNETKVCRLAVHHTPEPCNYSHAEVYFYIDNTRYEGSAPKSAKPFFRRRLKAILQLDGEYKVNPIHQSPS